MTDSDWRLRGQERDLAGATFRHQQYRAPSAEWDHDHCAFCWAKFMEPEAAAAGGLSDTLGEGYVSADGQHWFCPECFADFRARFGWHLAGQ